MTGHSRSDYLVLYEMSLLFAAMSSLATWATEYFLLPLLLARGVLKTPTRLTTTAVFGTTVLLSCTIGAIIANFTVAPGFLGSVRAVIMLGMFFLLFLALFSGISLAIYYYRQSLDRARAEQELVLARRIQRSFLITDFPQVPRLDIHALNLSSKEVSGDFYDVVSAGDGVYLLAIADVSGKGVPAALLTSMLQASLRTQAGITDSVAAMLANMNRLAYRSTTVNQFATFFLARLQPDPLRLRYSNAGHNYPVLQRADGRQELLERGGVVIGILEDAGYEEASLSLESGDRLIFYTDGVNEAENAAGEMFGEDRLRRLIGALPAELTAREIVERIVGEVRAHLGGAEAGDDITVLALRVR